MSRVIPDALVDHAAELVKSGAELKTAASIVGCNADELSKKLRKIGISTDNRFSWDSYASEIIAMYASGMSSIAIAYHFGKPRHAAASVLRVITSAGVNRTRRDAGLLRGQRETPERRKENLASARARREENAKACANSGKYNPIIGVGEREILGIFRDAGVHAEPQVLIDNNYLVDIAVGNVAIEVKTCMGSAMVSVRQLERFKKLRESGYLLVYVVVNHMPTLMRHAHDLISNIQLAQGHPAASGEYWVIRCTLEQIGTHTDVDHFSVERRTPKLLDVGAVD